METFIDPHILILDFINLLITHLDYFILNLIKGKWT